MPETEAVIKCIASCKCGEQEVDIKSIADKYGFIHVHQLQCVKCLTIVSLIMEEQK